MNLLASFDFNISLFEPFMKQVPDHLKESVRNAIRKSPFKYVPQNKKESFPLNFSACLSEWVIQNGNDDYIPLIVKNFF